MVPYWICSHLHSFCCFSCSSGCCTRNTKLINSSCLPWQLGNNIIVFFYLCVDGLIVSHLHPPVHRRPSKVCCLWLTCSPRTPACSQPGTTARPRATLTAGRLAKSLQQPATASVLQPNGLPKNHVKAAAWTVVTCSMMMMTRTTWTPASRTQTMVRFDILQHRLWRVLLCLVQIGTTRALQQIILIHKDICWLNSSINSLFRYLTSYIYF